MKTLLITISLFIAISSCAKKEKEDSTDTTSNSLFVAVGTNGTILTSSDTITWNSRTTGTTNKLRAGMRYSRKYHDDNISIMNQWQQYNFISAYISIQMLKTFEPDYAWNKFGEAYKKLVKEHDGWSETDCVGFVHGDERFSELNRGTDINRLCIVDKLGDI